jgi:protein TonB
MFSVIFLNYINKSEIIKTTGMGDGKFVISNLPPELIKKKEIVPELFKKPLKLFRASRAFLPPVITKDEDIDKVDSIPTNEDLNKSDAAISSVNYKGDPGGREKIIDADPSSTPQDNSIHNFVEQMPQYPGGEEEFFKYLSKNINYPRIPLENGITGTVTIQFVVFASGEIGDIKVLRGFDASCENEAVRVFKKMSRWIPGKQNGNAVNVQMCIPVRFSLKDQ